MSGAQLKADARKLMFDNAPKLFAVSILYLLMLAVLTFFISRLPGTVDLQDMYRRLSSGEMPDIMLIFGEFRPMGVVLALLLYLFVPVLDLGYMSYCLKIKRGQQAQYKDILDGFQIFLKGISLYVITTIFILLWSLLLVVPGIVAAYRYSLAYYILLDDPSKGIFQCIDESSVMMNGGKLELCIIDISFLGWYILDLSISFIIAIIVPYFPLPPVMIWLAPYRGVTIAGFYEYRKNILAV